jgi:phosphoglycolate phosphatase
MSRRFDLIAFDWDGTLFDSTAHIVRAIQSACVEVGAPAPSDTDAAYVIGMGLRDALLHCAPSVTEDQYPALSQAYRRHYIRHQQELVLFQGVLPMLQDLKARQHLLAVATGKSRRGLNEALAQAELHHLFDSTRTADETASKPHPLMLQELMAELGVAPERVLMIGDTTHDLEMATRAGVASVAVSYGAHDPASFGTHAPLFIAHSTRELHTWLTTV